jgi:EPS-associated MarR family transcriptional regulator
MAIKVLTDETRYRLLKLLERNPQMSQRQLAKSLDISLGKLNYCLKGVMEKGWVKVHNFKNSSNKLAYAYVLTPAGIEARAKVAMQFLKLRLREYEELEQEIEELRREVDGAK